MAADLIKIVNSVRDDLKKAYEQNPGEIWRKPFVVFVSDGGARFLDGVKDEAQLFEWVTQNLNLPKLEAIVIGRMVVKRSSVIDPNTNEGTITEKAIMVMGRDMRTERVRVSITPCHEHRDYRTDEDIEQTAAQYDPAIAHADINKPIFDPFTGKILSRLTAKFGQETVMDTRQGHKFLMDPLIQGIKHVRDIDQEIAKAQDVHDPKAKVPELPPGF
jgi:hypothetical protein